MIKKILAPFVPPILVKLLRTKQRPTEQMYDIGDFQLKLPPGHTLPKYQRMHKLFDRFLPIMARQIPDEECIIDVGANVGDTALMMHGETGAHIICIEPSEKFHSYLKENIERLEANRQKKFEIVQCMVGTSEIKGELTHYDGSAKLVTAPEVKEGKFVPLDEVSIGRSIGLIKVDTDGFDYDVLLSGSRLLAQSKPILFWENQLENETQKKGYEKLYKKLLEEGYDQIYVFDNFGNLMLEKASFENLISINHYLLSMETKACTRTYYFVDVLAATAKDAERVKGAIQDFKSEWINK